MDQDKIAVHLILRTGDVEGVKEALGGQVSADEIAERTTEAGLYGLINCIGSRHEITPEDVQFSYYLYGAFS